jgi:hypothetical protein
LEILLVLIITGNFGMDMFDGVGRVLSIGVINLSLFGSSSNGEKGKSSRRSIVEELCFDADGIDDDIFVVVDDDDDDESDDEK